MRVRPDYFYRQSAVIPFRRNANGLSVLLITTRKRSRWIIPKGVVEPDLTALDSALKEADEEAGVRGRPLAEPLGSYAYEKWGDVCEVEVYAMAVEQQRDQWPEDFRGREWLPVAEAARRVEEPALRQMIESLQFALAAQGS